MSNAVVMLPYTSLSTAALKALVDTHGYAHVDGIPADFDHAAFCAKLGPLVPQYNGELICSITPDVRYEHLDHPLTRNPLPPHTDGYEYEGTPPEYLALWCVVPPADGGGRTTLGDMRAFADSLSADTRQELATRRFRFVSGIEETDVAHLALHPLLAERPGKPPIARFSHEFTEPADDPFLAEISKQVLAFFEQTCVAVAYEPNSLLVWDNFRMVHGRTGFEDARRHLRRVWLSGD